MASLTVDHVIVSEADGFVDVVVRLIDGGAQTVSVNYATQADTASNGNDYSHTAGALSFSAGETTQTVRVFLTQNTIAEGYENFFFVLSSPTNATISNNVGTIGIVDNDTTAETPGLFVRDVVVDEKAGTASFVVMLGGPTGQASNSTVTVDYATANGTAIAGSDYTATNGTLTFAAGETVKTVTVDITNDATAETFERFYLDLSNTSGATLLDGRGAAVIGASDSTAVAQPRISVSDMIVSESDGYVDVVVSLSAPGQNPVSVNFSMSNDTASNSNDYQYYNSAITFATGQTTQVVRIELEDDVTAEGYESFFFNLSGATNATIAKPFSHIGIVDNDTITTTPNLFVRDVVVDEKAGTASFVVMLGGPTGQASNSTVTVDYATANGSATAGGDYVASSGTLTFAAGETVKTVVVDIVDDATAEGFERFNLNLSNANGATVLDGQARAVIGASDGTAVAQPRISVSDMIVSESDGYVDVVVSLSAPGQNPVSVNFSMSNDTASNSNDYQYYNSAITFATGQTTQVVRIELEDDVTAEGYESFFFNLSGATNATIAKPFSHIGIVDDDTVVDTPNLFVRDVVVDEKAGTASFVVMLGGPTGQASNSTVTVDYATANGTALAVSDYVASSGTLTFAAGETVKTVVVDIVDDATAEGFERFNLNLSDANGATVLDGQARAVIGASDGTAVAQPRISVSDMIVSESDGYVDIVVSLSAPGQNPVSVNFSMSNDTASNSNDYQYYNSAITFATGQTTQVVRIELEDDVTAEGYESFFFNLSGATNATIAKPFSHIGIVDDDTVVDTPNLFVRDVVVDEKAGTASFVVMLGGPTGQASNSTVTVDYATANGSATAGGDYVASSGTLTFAAGETVKTVVVDIVDDATAEGFERFNLNLSNANGATVLDGQARAVIGASDGTAVAQPRISVSDMIVSESDGYVDVVVSLSAPGQNPVSVNFSMSNDTASNSNDYQYYNSAITFATGQTTQVVRIELEDDVTAEGYESFFFNLSGATNATIAKPFSHIGIVDDDTVVDTPNLFVRDVVVDEKAGTASFVVMLGGPTGQASNSTVTVDYATANGSATAGGDYVASSGTLTFAAGETAKTVVVDLVDDTKAEGLERFGLNLSNANSATIVDGRAVAEIGANDATSIALPRISVADVMVAESDGYVDLMLSLSAPGQVPVAVNFSMSNGTASNSNDYQYYNSTVGFAPGETTKAVRIEIENDVTAENLENFGFNLSGAVGATIARPNTSIGIVDDDSGVNVYSYGRSDDIYTVVATSDIVVENPGGGTDLVLASASYTLGANVENLTLIDGAAINGTGNALANVITGNSAANTLNGGAGNDRLNGGAGADTMIGGSGNDVFVVVNAGDIVRELAGGGTDRVESSRSYNLGSNVENLTLTGTGAINGTGNTLNNIILGNEAANVLKGGAGNDTLNGNAGADRMEGGTGNDTYVVESTGDRIVEALSAGIDTVLVNRTFTLGLNLDNLTLTGTGAFDGTGNGLNNVILGNAAANELFGLAGNDTLNGGAGADRMTGGTGNDTYYVDNTGDVVIELASAGIDTLVINRTASLSGSFANVENLTLSGTAAINGTGNASNNLITGNGAANRLGGGAGNDTLNGGVGADSLVGGAGNDTYVIDNAGDLVTESAGFGIDTVQTNRTTTLSGSLANVENLVLTGGAGLGGNGNAAKNAITGNSGANKLSGLAGNDTLTGGAGSDTVIGGAGNDVFVLDSKVGADRITDFSTPSDTVRISMAGIHVGDGDAQVENAVTRSAPGGFSKAAELVIFTTNAGGAITEASAAAQIGSATSAYATGDDRIFVVDYGTQSGVFLFDSSGANATVSANELTLLAVLTTASTAIPDYVFGP